MRSLVEAIGWAVVAGVVVYAMTGVFAVTRLAIYCDGGCSW